MALTKANKDAWTAERLTMLKSLHEQGLAASKIADEINAKTVGHPITRNAVIGKAHRLGLECQPKKAPSGPTAITAKTATPKIKHTDGRKNSGDAIKAIRARQRARNPEQFESAIKPLPFIMEVADVEPLHLTLMELERNSCRYPYGDGAYTFCGCKAGAGLPYCPPHMRITHPPLAAPFGSEEHRAKLAEAARNRHARARAAA